MRHVAPFAVSIVCALVAAASADPRDFDAPPEVPGTAAAKSEAPERPIYVALGVGGASYGGAGGVGGNFEVGIGASGFPVGIHAAVEEAAVTTSILWGANGHATVATGGLEARACASQARACGYVGVDVGYANVDVHGNGGFLSDSGFSHAGVVTSPRAALEIGRSTLRFRAAAQLATGAVSGGAGTAGVAAHW